VVLMLSDSLRGSVPGRVTLPPLFREGNDREAGKFNKFNDLDLFPGCKKTGKAGRPKSLIYKEMTLPVLGDFCREDREDPQNGPVKH